MATSDQNALAASLRDGWVVVGYPSTIMAAGAMTHSVLMQRDADLMTVTVVVNGGREIGRTIIPLARG